MYIISYDVLKTLGPVIGSVLYDLGGFILPFLTVGGIGVILSICLLYVIPEGEYEKQDDVEQGKTQKLTWSNIIRVIRKQYEVYQ